MVEINDDVPVLYNTNSQIIFKTIKLKSILYDYSDVKGTISIATQAGESK